MAMPLTYMKVTLQLSSPQKFTFYNVFYYAPTPAPSWTDSAFNDAATIGADLGGQVEGALSNVLTTNTTIVGSACELHKDGQVYATSNINGITGVVSDDEEDDIVAVIIQKRTATAGRSGRGRWFLGPVPESMTDENFLTDIAYPSFTGVMTSWTTSVTSLGAEWKPQLYSPKMNSLYEITSGYVDHKLGRLSGRKSHSLLT